VAIEVLRDGELMRYYLARGPIGISMKAAKRPPYTSW
jgi:hypothetical protein